MSPPVASGAVARPALSLLAAVTPAWLIFVHTVDWLPDGARLWLPTYLVWFVGGMMLAVLQVDGCARVRVGVHTARGGVLLHRLDTDRGGADDVPLCICARRCGRRSSTP